VRRFWVPWRRNAQGDDSTTVSAPVDCSAWRQGDVFYTDRIWVTNVNAHPECVDTPDGIAVISQSCDASRSDRDRIQVSPVVKLESATMRAEIESGRRINYASLKGISQEHFADLSCFSTLPKSALNGLRRTPPRWG
jgi:hypothetical protein